jgi:hypothetical protein
MVSSAISTGLRFCLFTPPFRLIHKVCFLLKLSPGRDFIDRPIITYCMISIFPLYFQKKPPFSILSTIHRCSFFSLLTL